MQKFPLHGFLIAKYFIYLRRTFDVLHLLIFSILNFQTSFLFFGELSPPPPSDGDFFVLHEKKLH